VCADSGCDPDVKKAGIYNTYVHTYTHTHKHTHTHTHTHIHLHTPTHTTRLSGTIAPDPDSEFKMRVVAENTNRGDFEDADFEKTVKGMYM